MSEVVLLRREGPVLILTMNRPEALNALNPQSNQALKSAIGGQANIGHNKPPDRVRLRSAYDEDTRAEFRQRLLCRTMERCDCHPRPARL